ncbi:unnamed protein product [Owenia fusiformis]|uniref:Uncharacterized protein n=1 Tax=Owenia fusiformis TaxID=6347 RepID=A0A8J1UGA4_OWEFU|nr:unnamed protein product [Owenia fusiformis]
MAGSDSWLLNRRLTDKFGDLVNREEKSDIKFAFPGSSKVIYGHKLILSVGSPVFDAMFYGPVKETTDTINIPDIIPEAFLELVRFIYSERVQLTIDNVVEVKYAAKKYLVPQLEHPCDVYMKECLKVDTVCSLMNLCYSFRYDESVNQCLEFISANTTAVLRQDNFKSLHYELLKAVLELDPVTYTTELEMFEAAIQWAECKCLEEELEPSPENIRTTLGDAIYLIHYGALTMEEYASFVSPTRIIPPELSIEIFEILGTKQQSLKQGMIFHFPESVLKARGKAGPVKKRFKSTRAISQREVEMKCQEVSE